MVCATQPRLARPALAEVSWGVLPLVAGLFVLVAGLSQTGLTAQLAHWVRELSSQQGLQAVFGSATAGVLVGVVSNIVNNLPAGLFAASALAAGHASDTVTAAVLIGVDLGPNLSITGSLATLLWLHVLAGKDIRISWGYYFRVGIVLTLPVLFVTLAALAVSLISVRRPLGRLSVARTVDPSEVECGDAARATVTVTHHSRFRTPWLRLWEPVGRDAGDLP